MCNTKSSDFLSIIASIIVGIVISAFVFRLCYLPVFFPIFGAAFAAFVLLLLVLTASSLLRQDKRLNACICATGKRLLIPAVLLLAAGAAAFAICALEFYSWPILFAIAAFLLAGLITYIFFSLCCFLTCLVEAGCPHHCRDEE